MLARERGASTTPAGVVAAERTRVDRATRCERDNQDAILEQERQRSDGAVQAQRTGRGSERTARALRADTDEKLGAERLRVIVPSRAFDSTEQALSLAEGEVERRSNVLAMVAHELRIAVIAMNTEFIVESAAETDVRESASELQRSVARKARLLQDLVDLARIEGGIFRIVKQDVDVGELMSEILAAYGPLFAKRGVAFTCAPPAAGTVATFDHDRIVQVVSNLVSNAMKFTPQGGTVNLCMEQRPGTIELAVKDTGTGIAASALPRVFDRFWQGNSEPGTGLGLGLYICERIIAAARGADLGRERAGQGDDISVHAAHGVNENHDSPAWQTRLRPPVFAR